ncbi:MAG TPA: methyltransferase, partial [Nitrospiria bacterium]|nr:methyltransferase [Nitrospiria bacterium]
SRLVGVDIIPEAREAAERDRAGLYDAYYLADFCKLEEKTRKDVESWAPNCLTTVAALGFGDIPAAAFIEAFNITQEKGWVAFNIKETFLNESDDSGFSSMIRNLIFSGFFDLYHLERYRHRFSIEGKPLSYIAVAGRKKADITPAFIKRYGS